MSPLFLEATTCALRDTGLEEVESVPARIEALREEEGVLRGAAWEALRAITGENFGLNPKFWQRWWEEQE